MNTFKQKSLFAALAGLGVLGVVDSAPAVGLGAGTANVNEVQAVQPNIDRFAVTKMDSTETMPATVQAKQIDVKGAATSGGTPVLQAKFGAGSSSDAPALWHAFSHGDALSQIGFQKT